VRRDPVVESPRVQEARTRVTLSCYGLSGAKPVTRHGRAAMSRRADEARPFPRYSGVLEGARTGCRRRVKFRRCARQLLEAWHDGPGAPPRLDGDLSLQGRRVAGSVTDLAVPPGTSGEHPSMAVAP